MRPSISFCRLAIFVISSFALLPCLGQVSLPPIYTNSSSVNYVRTWDATAPEASDVALIARPLRDVKMTTQYIDGLGRPIQTVVKSGSVETSGTVADMVSSIHYDNLGRETYKYLPSPANSSGGNTHINDGLFKLNPFQQQATFMSSQYGSQGETFFYGKTDFETSPFNRVEKTMAPGNSWVGNNLGVAMKYWLNTAIDAVRIWSVTNNAGSFGTYSSNTTYPAGTLYKNVTMDEQGSQIIEFKDKEGKVILKKVQLTSATTDAGTGSGHAGWLCTYYIYDDLNNLRCVIQPRGVELLPASGTLTDATILDEQCFRYEYDEKNRMIIKKVPGAGEVWMVYDTRDRIVLTQDANLRVQGKWMYTTYDEINRPEATGLWTNSNDRQFHAAQAAGSIAYPDLSGQTADELTRTFYDNYGWISSYGNPVSSTYDGSFNSYLYPASSSWPYAQANTSTTQVKGMVTGTRTKVLGTSSTYLYSVSFYDVKGRVLQVQSTNISTGTDIITTQYTWAGQPLSMVQRHEKAGTGGQTSIIVTQMTYDDLGRVTKVDKKISSTLVNGGNMGATTTIAQNEYDKLGQLKKKKLAPAYNTGEGLETINYDYNIRGWLLGANRAYLATTGQNGTTKFGYELGYDKTNNSANHGFSNTLYNGNITGMIWKSDGDDVKRKYDFTYDLVNRLMKASYEQDDGTGSWNITTMSYNMQMGNGVDPLTAYDANGNIKAMKQYGWKLGSPADLMDNLSYTYSNNNNSNKLVNVTDQNNIPNTKLGDFRTSEFYTGKSNSSTDYTYDANGNLTKDRNKDIGTASTEGITYNHLNLPQTITVRKAAEAIKGTINYTYDASGNKLKKVTNELGAKVQFNGIEYTSDIITTTSYLAGFVYEGKSYSNSSLSTLGYNDRLQFAGHEEGRFRFVPAEGIIAASLQYDYMLKDHLGNVRMVLTQQQRTDAYPEASMELGKEAIEESLYNNLPETRVTKGSGYPNDPYTNPNNLVAKTGPFKRIGPSVMLRVMAGDKINLRVSSYYFLNGAQPGTPINILGDLLSNLGAGIGNITGSHGGSTQAEIESSGVLTPGAQTFLNSQNYDPNKPKAYLNWVLFDDQFNYVSSCSGADPVGSDDQLKIHIQNGLPMLKNGYLYVFLSNASGIDVFFDNLQVTHIRGPLLEETHYYPFGLVMNGISSKAHGFGGPENKKRYQAYEFDNDFDLNLYESFYRTHDPQLGRFWQIDPMPYDPESPYVAMGNNPIKNFDILGDELGGTDKESANRQKDIINNSIKSDDGAAFRSLVKLKKDGMTFKSINQKKLDKAISQISNIDERALAKGYGMAINSADQMFVKVVNRGESPQLENKKLSDQWSGSITLLADKVGRLVDEQKGGGVTEFVAGQSLSIIVLDPVSRTTYENRLTGEISNVVATPEEVAAHEILGHALGNFNRSPTYRNQDAIRMSNVFRRASGDDVLYRNGAMHPPGNIKMSSAEANQIPSYLKD